MARKKASIPIHEVAFIFPEMDEAEYRDLRDNIVANGLREPIWLYEGKIIDGKHRYNACIETGAEPHFREWDGKGSLVEFVVSLNLYRRHLTSCQKAAIAAKILPMLRAEARRRQGARTDLANIREKFPEGSFGRAAAKASDIVHGTNSRYIADAAKILEVDLQAFELVVKGRANISQAKQIISLPEKERLDVYQSLKSGVIDIREAIRSAKADLRMKEKQSAEGYDKALDELKRWAQKWEGATFPGWQKFKGVVREIMLLIESQPQV